MAQPKKSKNLPETITALPRVEIFIKKAQIAPKRTNSEQEQGKGLKFQHYFSDPKIDPYDQIEWEKRSSKIIDEKGNVISGQDDVEVPKNWSQLATDILVSKYFRKAGLPDNNGETSAKQVIARIARTIRIAGQTFGNYFASEEDALIFEKEITWLMLNQAAAFNSPVWFNVGLYQEYGIKGTANVLLRWNPKTNQSEYLETSYEYPQCSACFIQSLQDDLMSIFNLVKNEAKLFKFGSGTGTNFSSLRSYHESLSGGGTSSGLMSFLKVFDSGAGATKSGGITRRAAKMVILNADHPEIFDFVTWKAKEEEKARILIEHGGLSSDFNGEAYKTVGGQNSNNSVRVTDDFMRAVEQDKDWSTRARTSGEIISTFKAKQLMDEIVNSAWVCADPGLQFDTEINKWHTCKKSGRINGSNPCSEYMFLDDSSCNLASINVMKFLKPDLSFDVEGYRRAVRAFITAMEIIVAFSSYPTEKIAENSYKFRPLGLGYANVGTLLMVWGIPYDSERGRTIIAALTAILTGHAYKTSAELAREVGPFQEYLKNKQSFLEVMEMHKSASYKLKQENGYDYLIKASQEDWEDALEMGKKFGYRNAQTSVIAPTGTIGLLMDCDSTGIEPAFSLVAYKKLAGGGAIKIVNNSVPQALKKLGYNQSQIEDIITYIVGLGVFPQTGAITKTNLLEKGLNETEIAQIETNLKGAFDISFAFNANTISKETVQKFNLDPDNFTYFGFNFLQKIGFDKDTIKTANQEICGHMMIEGAPHIKEEDLAVFDCATTNGSSGKRFIEPMGHVKMIAAIQPFISGAISKTVNMPNTSTREDIAEIYMQSWKLGVKAISIYRDGSKHSQPLNTKNESEEKEQSINIETKVVYKPLRKRMPDERRSITHKFVIGNHKGYITVGLFENGQPGEIFVIMAKQGSVISGLMNSFATAISISLQYGVPLRVLVNKFIHSRFEPSGFTHNPQIQMAKSIVDYIFRYLALKFLSPEDLAVIGLNAIENQNIAQNELAFDAIGDNESQKEDLLSKDLAEEEKEVTNIPVKEEISNDSMNFFDNISDAPACDNCGGMMVRSGTCYKCLNCGSTTGCS